MNGWLVRTVVGLVALLALVTTAAPVAASGPSLSMHAAASTPVTGNITGPTVLATGGTATYRINATGGPAFAPNGTEVGNLTYYASVAAGNLTGITILPATGLVTAGRASETNLTVSSTVQLVTITVMVSSRYQTLNQSINLSYPVHVVTPYVVRAALIASSSVGVLSFPVQIDLDGSPVGTVTVPNLQPSETYNLTYSYATTGLPPGEHTFSISLVDEHGLVTFANGSTVYSSSFYVASPAPSYTWWYVAGAVAFFGVLFIFATRVAARRRGALRK